MPSMKNILLLAFATVAYAQSQISDGQIQVPTHTVLTTAPAPIATGTTGVPIPPTNGTFTTGAPAATSPVPYTGAANILSWSKEIVVVGAAAAGYAML